MNIRILLPIVLIISISLMYFMSVDMTSFNRADASMILMTLLAAFNQYTASRWYHIGFMTFQKLKEQEKTATSIIERLLMKIKKQEGGITPAKLVTVEPEGLLDRIKGINKSTKS